MKAERIWDRAYLLLMLAMLGVALIPTSDVLAHRNRSRGVIGLS